MYLRGAANRVEVDMEGRDEEGETVAEVRDEVGQVQRSVAVSDLDEVDGRVMRETEALFDFIDEGQRGTRENVGLVKFGVRLRGGVEGGRAETGGVGPGEEGAPGET